MPRGGKREGAGNKPYQRDDRTAQLVRDCASIGLPHERIAYLAKVSVDTLTRHYPDELEEVVNTERAIVNMITEKARNGDLTASFFWLKTRRGYRETNRQEVKAEVAVTEMPTVEIRYVEASKERVNGKAD